MEDIQFIAIGGDIMLYMFFLSPVALAAGDPPTMASFLADLTAAFTTILSGVTSTANTITGHPFLLFTVIFLFAGGVIGIMGRILSRG